MGHPGRYPHKQHTGRGATTFIARATLAVPADRRPPLLFLRDIEAERQAGLALSGLLILTAWTRPSRRKTPLTADQAEAVAEAEARLIADHAAVGPLATWMGQPIAAFTPASDWIARKVADHIAVPIRLRWRV